MPAVRATRREVARADWPAGIIMPSVLESMQAMRVAARAQGTGPDSAVTVWLLQSGDSFYMAAGDGADLEVRSVPDGRLLDDQALTAAIRAAIALHTAFGLPAVPAGPVPPVEPQAASRAAVMPAARAAGGWPRK
jgi:hypothetical protein